ncbi:unnamed protein product [Lampetra planeri]
MIDDQCAPGAHLVSEQRKTIAVMSSRTLGTPRTVAHVKRAFNSQTTARSESSAVFTGCEVRGRVSGQNYYSRDGSEEDGPSGTQIPLRWAWRTNRKKRGTPTSEDEGDEHGSAIGEDQEAEPMERWFHVVSQQVKECGVDVEVMAPDGNEGRNMRTGGLTPREGGKCQEDES